MKETAGKGERLIRMMYVFIRHTVSVKHGTTQ